ncbi:MAG: hypothetical protein JO055_07590 [Alphaproteobacteria bacterium]|nr:hypothetical protein [Alphaproteobacteria bacterium]
MIIRLHFVNNGQPLGPMSAVSQSPRIAAAGLDNGCVELFVLPRDLATGSWAARAAMAKARRHQPLLEQVAALAALVNSARNHDELAAPQIAERNAAMLSRARELADSIGDATIATADAGLREIKREAEDEVEAARRLIRRYPLRAVGIAAFTSAILTLIYGGGRRRQMG